LGSPVTDVPKSTPGHGGRRPGAGRPKGSGAAKPAATIGRPPKTEQNDAYTVLAKAKAKRETYRAQMEELRYREAARELIPAIEYERALASAFKLVASALESLPDVLERDAGIDGPAVERCQTVIDRIREDLYASLVNG
jgi:hypothetical protein